MIAKLNDNRFLNASEYKSHELISHQFITDEKKKMRNILSDDLCSRYKMKPVIRIFICAVFSHRALFYVDALM